ncbi:MAG: hypothetical protein OXC91_02230 [Rhodobacteraceae bacterium]|nr:hypothetical protein [Paracoccaceae bacterium]
MTNGEIVLPPVEAHPSEIAKALFPPRPPRADNLERARTRRNDLWREHPLIPSWVNIDKVDLDRFFTRPEVAQACYADLLEVMAEDYADPAQYRFVDPAAGTGVFYDLLPAERRIGVELVEGRTDFERADFLSWRPPANGYRHAVIGNPPFGYRAWLALAFLNHAAAFADYIGFILPMGFQSDGKGSPKFRVDGAELVHTRPLVPDAFVLENGQSAQVHALWQVWRRGINNRPPVAKCDQWLDLFTVDHRKERLCGQERLHEADWFLQRTFYGDPPTLVKSFDAVRYGCGYGIVPKKGKRRIVKVLREADWLKHSNLAAHNCRHISMYHIREAVMEAGFVDA